jgi:hypothetical protein
MSVKDNRGVCNWCGGKTSEQSRVKVVFQKKSGEESWHLEAHRGECFANLCMALANGEVGVGEVKED